MAYVNYSDRNVRTAMLFERETIPNIQKLFFFLRLSRVNLWYFPLSAFLSLGQSLTVLYSTFLLIPLAHGIIANDFTHVAEIRGVGQAVSWFPGLAENSTRLFIFLVIWIYFFTILRNVFKYLSFLSIQMQAKLATAQLRQLLIGKCLSYNKDFYDKNTISYLQSVLTKSTGLIEGQFKLFQNVASQFFLIITYLAIMCTLSWKLTILTVILFPIIAGLTGVLTKKIKDKSLEHQQLSIKFNDRIFNMLYCMPVIKGFVKEREELNNFARASEEEIEQSYQVQKVASLASPVEDMGTMTGILLVALGLAGMLHSGAGMAPSNAFIFFYVAMRLMPHLNIVEQFRIKSAAAATAIHDIEQVMNYQEASQINAGGDAFDGLKDGICFKDLTFRYGTDGPLILDRVNFTIEKGSIVAIVGPSGSGKTTLISLLLRFYDCPPDSILIDGKDMRSYDIASLRQHIALVSQDVLLFNDTIRKNITYGANKDISDELLKDLAGKVVISDFVERLPNKYETVIGERGARLSGGERQRISIARAIMKDPEVLILDEATSALDSDTESKIGEFLSELSAQKTLIIIAHRLSTIRRADKIIYIDQGRVLESGTLQELIDKKGRFFKSWQAQKL